MESEQRLAKIEKMSDEMYAEIDAMITLLETLARDKGKCSGRSEGEYSEYEKASTTKTPSLKKLIQQRVRSP